MYKDDLLYKYFMDETLCLYKRCLYLRMAGSGVDGGFSLLVGVAEQSLKDR